MILNEGGEGVPLSQLTDVADEAEKFLRYLAEDAGISVKRADWLARNFENRSVRFDIEREANVSLDEAKEFNRKFEYIDRVKSERRSINGEVKYRTLAQYTKIAKVLGPHEKVGFGLYHVDHVEEQIPYKYALLSKREAELFSEFLAEEVTYRGSLHGTIHDVGIEELSFRLRRTKSRELVKCDFREHLYQLVHEACEHRNALVYVHGLITARRIDREITKARIENIKAAPVLRAERYQAFFGADPNYSGQVASEDIIERGWYEH
jgi:hypothetical protein